MKDSEKDIAIIGSACLFPKAQDVFQYWENIISGTDCITEVPPTHWNIADYYDPNPEAPDKTYCKRGGFIPNVDFCPMEFGLPPNILEATDTAQILSLIVVKKALEDAGYGSLREFDRSRTGVILGASGGQKLIEPLACRLQYPSLKRVLRSCGIPEKNASRVVEKMKLAYVPWDANSFPGLLGNVIAGRIANRLDLGGINCVVDAACASSLAAVRMAINELTDRRCDMVLTGGVEVNNSHFAYVAFSKTLALSMKQVIRPFDADADGMILGEGIGMVVLKRLDDAERDGDRILAVIKGLGASSDGRATSIYAPDSAGQLTALRRAYEDAGFSPSTVDLIEAHGTGTIAGDRVELDALTQFLKEHGAGERHVALGSVKSQIGHTKAAAGAASLIKAVLCLHHKVLPPTINVSNPNSLLRLDESPLYLNTRSRPWIRRGNKPRRAGASAFGFGGANYHIVLEEYESEHSGSYRLNRTAESILIFGETSALLAAKCEMLSALLKSNGGADRYVELAKSSEDLSIPEEAARLGFCAATPDEALKCLQAAADVLRSNPDEESWSHPGGIFYRDSGLGRTAKVVALFPGQGSQYLDMGLELGLNFPPFREAYARMDNALAGNGGEPVSRVVFPRSAFDAREREAQDVLLRTENAQPAVGAFSIGMYDILRQCGFNPDFVAGHSFGELTALRAARVFSEEDYLTLVRVRAKAMAHALEAGGETGAMLAVAANEEELTAILGRTPQVTIANFNSPKQIVLAASGATLADIRRILEKSGIPCRLLPVSAAFHSPLVGGANLLFSQALDSVSFQRPEISVYSGITGMVYTEDTGEIRQLLKTHLLSPVLFRQEIENIYAAGGCVFVEVGPGNVLTELVHQTLVDSSHIAVSANARKTKDSDRQLREAVMQLRVAGLLPRGLDPYRAVHSVTGASQGPSISLCGANHVSESTRNAFINALAENEVYGGLTLDGSVTEESLMTQSFEQDEQVSKQRLTRANFSRYESFHEVHQLFLYNMNDYSQRFFQLIQHQFPQMRPAGSDPESLAAFERLLVLHHRYLESGHRAHEMYLRNCAENPQRRSSPGHQLGYVEQEVAPGNGRQFDLTGFGAGGMAERPEPADRVYKEQVTPLPMQRPHWSAGSSGDNGNDGEGSKTYSGLPAGASDHPGVEPCPDMLDEAARTLLDTICEATGYPVEMLNLDMDIEADLGIDSIKRLQIFAQMQERFSDLRPFRAEELVELRTLRQFAETYAERLYEKKKLSSLSDVIVSPPR